MRRTLVWGTAALAAVAMALGGDEAAGLSKAAPGVKYGVQSAATASLRRSTPNGRTDIIKAMGSTKWGDIELQ
jgi:hypothetical protein